MKFDYDSKRRTFYFFEGDESHRTMNICIDEDSTLLVDVKTDRAVGFLITNFDVLYPKHVTAIGTSCQELMLEYFSMYLRNLNHLREQAREEESLKKFVSGGRITLFKLEICQLSLSVVRRPNSLLGVASR